MLSLALKSQGQRSQESESTKVRVKLFQVSGVNKYVKKIRQKAFSRRGGGGGGGDSNQAIGIENK